MAKPKSPRGRDKRTKTSDKSNEDYDENSEDGTSFEQSRNISHTSTDSSYLNVSSRPDLSHHSDSYTPSSPETNNRLYPTLNTSTSSNSDSLDRAAPVSTSKSPATLYPPLGKFKTDSTTEGGDKSKENFEDRSSKIHANKNEGPPIPIKVLVICFLIIVASIALYFIQNLLLPGGNHNSTVLPFDKFVGHIKGLEQTFPKQNKRLWRTVKSSALHVLNNTNSDYPVVILMAATADHSHVSTCIASKIASSFELTNGLNPKLADIRDLQHLDPASQKQKLDEQLNSAFSNGQRKSFIIDNLQLLHPEAALLLHGYCDGENAPYKDVMILLLLHITEKDVMDNGSAAAIENYLDQLWSKGLDVDKIKALLSRVANNIVAIETEDDVSFKTACQ